MLATVPGHSITQGEIETNLKKWSDDLLTTINERKLPETGFSLSKGVLKFSWINRWIRTPFRKFHDEGFQTLPGKRRKMV